jgi:hypothetical protein
LIVAACGCSAPDPAVTARCAERANDSTFLFGDRLAGQRLVDVDERPAPPSGYSGFYAATRLANGALVAAGFDDAAREGDFEAGALWHSETGSEWRRVGVNVTEPAGQQVVRDLEGIDNVVVVVGATISDQDGFEILNSEPNMWRSSDSGRSYDLVDLDVDSGLMSGLATDGSEFVAVGYRGTLGDFAGGQIWTSTNAGQDWSEIDSPQGAIGLLDVAIDGDEWIVAGVIDSDGSETGQLWKSIDRGRTWSAEPNVIEYEDADWNYGKVEFTDKGPFAMAQTVGVGGLPGVMLGAAWRHDGAWDRTYVSVEGGFGVIDIASFRGEIVASAMAFDDSLAWQLLQFHESDRNWYATQSNDDRLIQATALVNVDDELWLLGRVDRRNGDLGSLRFSDAPCSKP